MKIQAPRGTNDVLPVDSPGWRRIERAFEDVARQFGYGEIRTPVFEEIELFRRSSGETSEVVSKQMYDFVDKGGRELALKPEGTAPAIRAYLEHSLGQPSQITRLWYFTQIFRYERPQKGRYRQAHQAGIELIGSTSPAADAEVIEFAIRFYEAIGLTGLEVRLNSIGRAEARSKFGEAILQRVASWLADQTEENQARARKNPLRLLDSKDPSIQAELEGLPPILDFLEPESLAHFEDVKARLTRAGINYLIDPGIVRGLDYYTDTVFEVQSAALGAQSSLCGGGRYDGLIQELGGPPTPAVGFGAGMERALIVCEALQVTKPVDVFDVFVVGLGDAGRLEAESVCRNLRQAGLASNFDLESRDMKRQLKAADRMGARFAVLIGDDELAVGAFKIRDLTSGDQVEVPKQDVADWFTRISSAKE